MFIGGLYEECVRDLSVACEIRLGLLPTRYLGLPLSPTKPTMASLQALLERITNKIDHWTAKLVSYARKIHLIFYVIYEMVNYWRKAFSFQKNSLEKLTRFIQPSYGRTPLMLHQMLE